MSMYDILKKLQNLTTADESLKLNESREIKSTATAVMESKFRQFLESEEKAKKDYDGDGKIESEKDEVWGSRLKAAAKKSEKVKEMWDPSQYRYGDELDPNSPYYDGPDVWYGNDVEELVVKVPAPYQMTDPDTGEIVNAGEPIELGIEVDCNGESFEITSVWGDETVDLELAGQKWIDTVNDILDSKLQKSYPQESVGELDELSIKKYQDVKNRATTAGERALDDYDKAELAYDEDPEQMALAMSRYKKHKKAADHAKRKLGMLESKEINFTADDINRLSQIKDLNQLKSEAFKLITTQSKNPMKPEKVEYFKSNLADKKSPMAIIKMMYDLLLSGEGHRVIGSRYSTNQNKYRDRFGEDVSKSDVLETENGMMEDEYRNPKFEYVDVELSQWRQMVRQQYPDAKIYAAPEEEGGTREAYVGSKFVGDWDGGSEIAGRILKSHDSLNEKSVSKAQQRFFGMVHSAQKGKKPASKEVAKVAKSMGKRDVTDFAKTKHKGLPKHVTESRIMEAHSTFEHILQRYPAEVKQFERTQQLDNDLYDALYDYYRNAGEMPYGVAKARSGDPMEWIADRFAQDIGIGHQEELPFSNELDEIAKLAGLSVEKEPVMDENAGPFGGPGYSPKRIGRGFNDEQYVVVDDNNPMQQEEFAGTWEECEAWIEEHEHHYPEKQFEIYPEENDLDEAEIPPIGGAVKAAGAAAAIGSGIKSVATGIGDTLSGNSNENEMDEGNEFSGALAAAKASGQKEFEVDGKKYTVKEDVNLNISATGEQDALNLIRKLSGLQTQDETCSCQDDVENHSIEVIPDTTGINVEEVPMEEERDIEYINTPREKIRPGSFPSDTGSDLHRSKKSYSDKPFRGDNPMAESTNSNSDNLWKKYSDMLKGLTK